MIRAILYMHQNSGAYAGVYTCDRTYQMKRTAIESQKERNALTCFNEKVQINNVKMGAFFYPHLPACPYFTSRDQYKPKKFVMAALNSSHKLQCFCI